MNLEWIQQHCEWVDDAGTLLINGEPARVYYHDPQRPVVQLTPNSAAVRVVPIVLFLITKVWVEDVVVDGILCFKNLRIVQGLDDWQRSKLAPHLEPHQLNSSGVWRQVKGGLSRWAGQERSLPHNVYATSGGRYIGRRGKHKTAIFSTVEETLQALEMGQWV